MSAPPWQTEPFAGWPPLAGDAPPPALAAHAGDDASVAVGVPLAIVGSATGGVPGYTFLWSVVSAPPGGVATFDDATDPTTNVTFTVASGAFVLRLLVIDSAGTHAADTVRETVTAAPAFPVIAWHVPTVPPAESFTTAAYSPTLDLFALLGSAGVYTSPGAEVWTLAFPAAAKQSALCWAPVNACFVVGLVAGGCAVSFDGVVWTPHAGPSLETVCETPTGTLLAGASTNVRRSVDVGVSWVSVSVAPKLNQGYVAAAVGVAVDASAFGPSEGYFVSNDDGLSWPLTAPVAPPYNVWMCARDTRLARFITTGTVQDGVDSAYVADSAAGVLWTLRDPDTDAYLYGIVDVAAAVPFAFACGDPNTSPNVLAATYDGATWFGDPGPAGSGWQAVAYSPSQNKLVMGSYNGDLVVGVPPT